VDAGPIDNPFRIEAMRLAQIFIGDDEFGDIAPGTQDPHAQERARMRREMELAVAHERYATNFNRDVRLPKPVSRSARNIISSGDL
jgi:hypothetical protein